MIVSTYYDWKERRIPNWVTLPGLGAGLALHGVLGGTDGVLTALWGAAVGAAVLILPNIMGWVGGGDLKLLAAVGALMGAPFALLTLAFASVAGGIMALGWLAITGSLGRSLGYTFLVWRRSAEARPAALTTSLPFGPALALGVLVAMFWR